MEILVLGHLVLDDIRTFDGDRIESPGGIYFPLCAFSALAVEGDVIRPVMPVGADAWDLFRETAVPLAAVDASECWRVERPNTRVRLFQDADRGYNTQLVSSLEPIPFERIGRAAKQPRLIYINMMTGHDITLETADALRAFTGALIYLDLHMVAYRVAADGRRSHAPVADRLRWTAFPDILQCNRRELAALAGGEEDEGRAARLVMEQSSLAALVVTNGAEGATVYRKALPPLNVAAVAPGLLVDTTGCGDVFGATLAYHLADGVDMVRATAAASAAAAYVAGIPGSIGMDRLRDALAGTAS